jgi:predicted dehydrogenase
VFRPVQFEAAVAAGKHVHVELPVAIDVPGLNRFQHAAQEALEHHRRISAGWLQACDQRLILTLQQLQQGVIGPIVSIQAFHPPHAKPLPVASSNAADFHWQLRNWMHFPWASGGSIVERRVRSLALVNSLLNELPVEARPVATERSDHAIQSAEAFKDDWQVGVEFTYPSGAKMISQAWDGKSEAVRRGGRLVVQGLSGWCDWARGEIYDSQSQLLWRASDHPDAIPQDIPSQVKLGHSASPLSGLEPWATLLTTASHGENMNISAQLAANSTLAALMGRMAISQQTRITWEEASQSTQVFDSISRPPVELGVDRVPSIERYLTSADR